MQTDDIPLLVGFYYTGSKVCFRKSTSCIEYKWDALCLKNALGLNTEKFLDYSLNNFPYQKTALMGTLPANNISCSIYKHIWQMNRTWCQIREVSYSIYFGEHLLNQLLLTFLHPFWPLLGFFFMILFFWPPMKHWLHKVPFRPSLRSILSHSILPSWVTSYKTVPQLLYIMCFPLDTSKAPLIWYVQTWIPEILLKPASPSIFSISKCHH